jgi:hypothetical protein
LLALAVASQASIRSGIESGTLGPELGRDAVAARDLVGEDQQQKILVRHLLPGEAQTLG